MLVRPFDELLPCLDQSLDVGIERRRRRLGGPYRHVGMLQCEADQVRRIAGATHMRGQKDVPMRRQPAAGSHPTRQIALRRVDDRTDGKPHQRRAVTQQNQIHESLLAGGR